jgi:hypothetical protein
MGASRSPVEVWRTNRKLAAYAHPHLEAPLGSLQKYIGILLHSMQSNCRLMMYDTRIKLLGQCIICSIGRIVDDDLFLCLRQLIKRPIQSCG